MCSTKVVAACIFNELLAAGLFLALDGTSMRTDSSTSGRKYRKSVNNAVFIRSESLFVVFLRKIWGCGTFGAAQASNPRKFSL